MPARLVPSLSRGARLICLSEEADRLELSKDGDYTSFSATFDLREGDEP